MSVEYIERAVVQQWGRATAALAAVRKRELQQLTQEETLRAADDLLSLVSEFPRKQNSSGLVEQQRIFTGGRS
ncbi:MAG: hypothetical protein ACRDPW_01260 [Mycobacteriales bacterium]